MLLKEKKADVTITFLVIGVIVVCFLTIFLFINNSGSRASDFSGVGLIETINSISQEQILYENTEFTGSYSDSFEKGLVNVSISGRKIIGTTTSPISRDILVKVEYTKP